MIIELHACFLLVAGTTSAILRTGLVELPRQVEDEGAAGGIVGGEVAIAEDDGLGLVGVEEVDAAQVGSQRAQAAERDVFLDAEVANDAGAGDAEVVVLSFVAHSMSALRRRAWGSSMVLRHEPLNQGRERVTTSPAAVGDL